MAAREGWLVLVDNDGRELSTRIPVVEVDGQLFPRGLLDEPVVTDPTAAVAVRFIDADGGVVSETPLD